MGLGSEDGERERGLDGAGGEVGDGVSTEEGGKENGVEFGWSISGSDSDVGVRVVGCSRSEVEFKLVGESLLSSLLAEMFENAWYLSKIDG